MNKLELTDDQKMAICERLYSELVQSLTDQVLKLDLNEILDPEIQIDRLNSNFDTYSHRQWINNQVNSNIETIKASIRISLNKFLNNYSRYIQENPIPILHPLKSTPAIPEVKADVEVLVKPTESEAPPPAIDLEKKPALISEAYRPAVLSLRLPNAKAGMPYEASLIALGLSPGAASGLRLLDSYHSELKLNPEALTLTGLPPEAGEYTFIARYPDETEKGPECSIELFLTVNPDPKTLWKNLPSDRYHEGLYWKADAEQAVIKTRSNPDYSLYAASQRGRSHAHVGSCRDDDFAIKELSENWLLMAVADGAGSAKYSRQGSKLACLEVAEVIDSRLKDADFSKSLDAHLEAYSLAQQDKTDFHPSKEIQDLFYGLLPQAALSARKRIEKAASEQALNEPDLSARDYATTLQITLAKKFSNHWFFASFAIGDGVNAVYTGEQVYLLNQADSGEYSGQTRFLTMGNVWSDASSLFQRLKYLLIPRFEFCLLMTDGVSDPKFESEEAMLKTENWHVLCQELKQVLNTPDPGQELLNWLNFWSEGEHDDRSLVLLKGEIR